MPRPFPAEFRQRAIELVRSGEQPTREIAKDLGISHSGLCAWVRQADIDEGREPGVTKDEHAELIELRRELRVAKMEIEILKRAAAFFARENILPK
jgi:transposase